MQDSQTHHFTFLGLCLWHEAQKGSNSCSLSDKFSCVVSASRCGHPAVGACGVGMHSAKNHCCPPMHSMTGPASFQFMIGAALVLLIKKGLQKAFLDMCLSVRTDKRLLARASNQTLEHLPWIFGPPAAHNTHPWQTDSLQARTHIALHLPFASLTGETLPPKLANEMDTMGAHSSAENLCFNQANRFPSFF